jgi:hypothetical protein
MHYSSEQLKEFYIDIIEHIDFTLKLARIGRHTGTRIVRFSNDIDNDVEVLITRVMHILAEKHKINFDYVKIDLFSHDQQEALTCCAKTLFDNCLQLQKNKLKNSSTSDIYLALSSGSRLENSQGN